MRGTEWQWQERLVFEVLHLASLKSPEIIDKNEPDKYLEKKTSIQRPGIKDPGGCLEQITKWEAHCLSPPYKVEGDAASGLYDTEV